MSTHENESDQTDDQSSPTLEEQSGAEDHDQDAEPSTNTPDGEPEASS